MAMKALIGRKIGMTQLFDDEGNVLRVTLIEAGPCTITQVKTMQRDGYNAVQIGFGQAKRPSRQLMGHLKAANVSPQVLKEIRLPAVIAANDNSEAEAETEINDLNMPVGHRLDASSFEVGDRVKVTATSKGKGFAGTIKRHNFSRGPKTHGSHNYRAPGSIGSMFPQHVFKGIRMAGRMGGQQVTTRGLKVVLVDPERNLIAVRGAVPGARRSTVIIKGETNG
jgi:large subunit ribosomal protein L3